MRTERSEQVLVAMVPATAEKVKNMCKKYTEETGTNISSKRLMEQLIDVCGNICLAKLIDVEKQRKAIKIDYDKLFDELELQGVLKND